MKTKKPAFSFDPVTNHHHLVGVFPIHNPGTWNAHTCLALYEHMEATNLSVELHIPSSDPPGRRPFTRDAIPSWLKRVVYRLDPDGILARNALRWRFRHALLKADVAYLWAGVHESLYADVRAAGIPLCVERTNCHRKTARPILEEAYRRVGLAPSHGITDADVAEEQRKLAMADWIFAPNPMVLQSLLNAGVPAMKTLPTSYGWSPERISSARRMRSPDAPTRVLYVGSLDIRKGAHLLLQYWADSGIEGQIEFCGQMSSEVKLVSENHLARPDVILRGHVENIAQAYADADIFAFPTLEEGGPKVIFEAMAHGLAILTTPMGSGGAVRDGIEGLVRDPYDRDAWISDLRRLASDPSLRARLGMAARERAKEFTWAKVGARRREMLLAAIEFKHSAG